MKLDNFISRTLTAVGAFTFFILVWFFFPEKGMPLLVFVIMGALVWEYERLVFMPSWSGNSRLPSFCSLFGKKRTLENQGSLETGNCSREKEDLSSSPPSASFVGSKPTGYNKGFFLFFLLSSLFFYCFYFFKKQNVLELFFIFLFLFFVFVFWILHKKKREQIFHGLCFSLVGWLYIVLPSVLFLDMFLHQKTNTWILFLCVVFLGDIFAYLGGQLRGSKKWAPALSPGKTWFGLFCGLLASGIGAVVLSFYIDIYDGQHASRFGTEIFDFPFSFFLFIFGAVLFFIAQTGDLFVSLLKRQAGVKNSGCLLPGHGGLLDRLDGLLLALPFVYFITQLDPFFIKIN
ncbi:MAG: phosphatidate cytidylyltransferase [Bdellovibrionales bacterium]|nr:phosphatidate cytidylyltransferase [Bdellovibrionales bacterium]